MGWNVRISSAFQPAGATPVFLPCLCEFFCPASGFTGLLLLCFFGGLFTFYPLNFFTCFIYSLASFTVQFFVDGITMSSFFTPRGARCRSTAPHHSTTPRHPASARALSLSLLLGLSPLAGLAPAALATPTQAAPEQQAQPAQADPEQATRLPRAVDSCHPCSSGRADQFATDSARR